MNLSVYENCLTAEVFGNVKDEEVFDYITRNKKAQRIRKYYGTDKYAKEKLNLPGVTWAGRFNKYRDKNNFLESSGYVYFDIDNYNDKNTIANIPEVKAVWTSLSGNGIGGIFKSDVTKETYTSTYREFGRKYNLNLDKTSDVSRINIISYDKDIIVKDEVKLFPSVSPELTSYTIDVEVNNEIEEACILAYNSTIKKGYVYQIGCRDNFCTHYFYLCNIFGVPLEYSINYLYSKNLFNYSDFNIEEKGKDIYSRNKIIFNTKQIDSINGLLRTKKKRY